MTADSLDHKEENNTQKLILFSYLPDFPSHTGVLLLKYCTAHITQNLEVEKRTTNDYQKTPKSSEEAFSKSD